MDKMYWTRWQWAMWGFHHPWVLVLNGIIVVAMVVLVVKRGAR